jgi:hypothetical protein
MKACERGSCRRRNLVLAAGLGVAVLLLGSGPPAHATLTITPTFDASITGDANAGAIEGAINSAIADFQNTYANNVTVNIFFEEGGGLGTSEKLLYNPGYATFRAQLAVNQAMSGQTDQATALAHLPIQANNPVTSNTDLLVSSANDRVLGQVTPTLLNSAGNAGTGGGFIYDGIIILNTSLTNPGSPGSSLQFSLKSVAQHEIDEVLGLGSSLGQTFQNSPSAEDLYRYQQNSSTRNYTTTGDNAWFSIDAANSLVQFNNSGTGDFGDWHLNSSPVRVQDAFATAGSSPTILNDGGAELTALDVIGYNRIQQAVVPEPSNLLLAAVGGLAFAGYGWMRRRRGTGEAVA